MGTQYNNVILITFYTINICRIFLYDISTSYADVQYKRKRSTNQAIELHIHSLQRNFLDNTGITITYTKTLKCIRQYYMHQYKNF